jgi:hypothetical protein
MLTKRTTILAGAGAFLALMVFPLLGFAQEAAEAGASANQIIGLAAGLGIALGQQRPRSRAWPATPGSSQSSSRPSSWRWP